MSVNYDAVLISGDGTIRDLYTHLSDAGQVAGFQVTVSNHEGEKAQCSLRITEIKLARNATHAKATSNGLAISGHIDAAAFDAAPWLGEHLQGCQFRGVYDPVTRRGHIRSY